MHDVDPDKAQNRLAPRLNGNRRDLFGAAVDIRVFKRKIHVTLDNDAIAQARQEVRALGKHPSTEVTVPCVHGRIGILLIGHRAGGPDRRIVFGNRHSSTRRGGRPSDRKRCNFGSLLNLNVRLRIRLGYLLEFRIWLGFQHKLRLKLLERKLLCRVLYCVFWNVDVYVVYVVCVVCTGFGAVRLLSGRFAIGILINKTFDPSLPAVIPGVVPTIIPFAGELVNKLLCRVYFIDTNILGAPPPARFSAAGDAASETAVSSEYTSTASSVCALSIGATNSTGSAKLSDWTTSSLVAVSAASATAGARSIRPKAAVQHNHRPPP
jgi:hypothetical protein